jgi:hypothetical protein
MAWNFGEARMAPRVPLLSPPCGSEAPSLSSTSTSMRSPRRPATRRSHGSSRMSASAKRPISVTETWFTAIDPSRSRCSSW